MQEHAVPSTGSTSSTSEGTREGLGDSREHQRKPLRLQLNYKDASCGGNFLYEYSKNISRGGIFIETHHPLPLGSELVVRFQPPGKRGQFQVEGEVVWVNAVFDEDGEPNPNPGMGVQWLQMTQHQRDVVATIVKAIAILPE